MSRFRIQRLSVWHRWLAHSPFIVREKFSLFSIILFYYYFSCVICADASLQHLIRTINELCKRNDCVISQRLRQSSRMWKDMIDLEVNASVNGAELKKNRNRDYSRRRLCRRRAIVEFIIFTFCVKISRFAFCYPFDDERAGWKKKSEIRWLCFFSLLLFCGGWNVLRWPAAHCVFLPVVTTAARAEFSVVCGVCVNVQQRVLHGHMAARKNVCAIPTRVHN